MNSAVYSRVIDATATMIRGNSFDIEGLQRNFTAGRRNEKTSRP